MCAIFFNFGFQYIGLHPPGVCPLKIRVIPSRDSVVLKADTEDVDVVLEIQNVSFSE